MAEITETKIPILKAADVKQLTLEQEADPLMINLPEGASISSGPLFKPNIISTGAPANSSFRLSGTEPQVDGASVSRHGTLYIMSEGKWVKAQEYAIYNHLNTRKNKVLPGNYNGAKTARVIPDFTKEKIEFN